MSRTRRMAPVEEQLFVLMSGVDYGDPQLYTVFEQELRERLEEDRPLRVYLGVDPTASSLTLGHTVPLRKLRQFQEFGHHAIFLIGDFTALIGDPSDKNKLRPMLTPEEVKRNEATYFEQAAKFLDPARTEVRHNSEWLAELKLLDVIRLTAKFTVAEMLRRETFRKRFDAGDAIFLHEFLYALMQGYDAYALACDVQIGGTEQLFNLMAGRKIQEDAGQRPHVPITLPILVGTDGKTKMSKSAGNYIGIDEPPEVQYGKVMSLPDHVLPDYFILATNLDRSLVASIIEGLRSGARDPMETKKLLARTVVAECWGEDAALRAEAYFERTVQRKEVPEDAPAVAVRGGEPLLEVLVAAGVAPSKREAKRLFQQRAIAVDGEVVDERATARPGSVVQVGKRRWLRLVEQ